MKDKFMSIAARVGSQRHLGAIRDGFVTLMPLLIIGSMGTLINQIPTIINEIAGTTLAWPSFISTLNSNIWWGTFGMITLYVVATVAYNLAKFYESDRLSSAVVALACFTSIIPSTATMTSAAGEAVSGWGFVHVSYINAQGLFVGILVALLATELFVRLKRVKKLQIQMPEGVPPAVGRAFSALFPGAITIFITVGAIMGLERLCQAAMGLAEPMSIFALITKFVSAPLTQVADGPGYLLLVIFAVNFLWFFGLHGSSVLSGILQPISITMMEANAAAFAVGAEVPHIVTLPFMFTFIHLGGAGSSLGLVISILLVSRSKQRRAVGRLSLAPGMFNINEPCIFGLPVVLNPVLMVPWILGPLVIALTSYYATFFGLVPKVIAIIPWATPPIISGFLATGGAWQGAALQIVNLVIITLIYMPFVKIADRMEMKKEQEFPASGDTAKTSAA